MIYDDVHLTTSVALLNPTDQQVTVVAAAYSESGAQIGSAQILLLPQQKLASTLKSINGLGAIVGRRGLVRFSVSNGTVSILALRFGGEAFTSIIVPHR